MPKKLFIISLFKLLEFKTANFYKCKQKSLNTRNGKPALPNSPVGCSESGNRTVCDCFPKKIDTFEVNVGKLAIRRVSIAHVDSQPENARKLCRAKPSKRV